MPRHLNDDSKGGRSGAAKTHANGDGDGSISPVRAAANLGVLLHRCRRALWVLSAVAFVAFIASLLVPGIGRGYSLLALTALIWLSFAVAYAHAMPSVAPGRRPDDAGFLALVRWRARQILAWCLLVLMASLAGVLVLFTLRALSAGGA